MSGTDQERARAAHRRWIEREWEGQDSLAVAYCLDALLEAGGGDYGEFAMLAEPEQALLLRCFCGLLPPRAGLRRAARDFYEQIGPGRLSPFAAELAQPEGGRLLDGFRLAEPGRPDASRIGPELRQALSRHGCTPVFAADASVGDTWQLVFDGGLSVGHAVAVGGLWEAYSLVRPNSMWGMEKVGAHADLEDAVRDVLVNYLA
ncbi:hypothetical protein LO763_10875 [Glycomyces sp. A-F 0318]|uniref:hypothetical protein n=1 Tax=Glycomyces amatae TaxID=2881355 RepID=UPI001E385B9B|nr:hypothetical protein [Glycomyces amatae]MCD0444127.1 hypothetical protein [Glycomyces amatae]